ncbi:MAG: hypothetical protein PHG44_06080 [Lentisphaeria bacterium]|jgi:hypothetical protein|nr:hypothetical protein [Lentisphaeria bacterium]
MRLETKVKNPLILTLILALLVCAGGRADGISSDNAALQFADGVFSLGGRAAGSPRFEGECYVYEDSQKKTYSRAQALDNPLFRWESKLSSSEKLFRLDCVVENLSAAELRLEPGLCLRVPRGDQDLFWGGFDVQPVEGKDFARLGFKGKTSKHIGGGLAQPFPVAALIAEDMCVFLGQFQFDQVSWNAAQYKIVDEHSAELRFSQRLVLAPGQSLDFRFLLGLTPRRFGREENVVQAFYDAYPEWWRPLQGQDDPYIWYAHSQYRAWYYKPDREKERRYYAAVDWCYTPYKRAGDPWGKEELWDYKPEFPIKPDSFGSIANGIYFDYTTRTHADFHRLRKEIFSKNAKDFGYAFYTGAAWCEINLAKEKYADAINYDTEGGVPHILGPWSTGHDREIRVFPMGTSFSEDFRKDCARLWKELDLPGFAFDCGTPGVNYRGPACNNPELPGRAWDQQGLFIDELVAINDMIDFVHALDADNPPFVWKNGQGRADYVMIETSIFNPIFRSWMPLTRYNIGQRPAVIHSPGYLFDSSIPNWRNLGREEFYREMHKLADHAILTDFQYGVSQNHVTQNGNPQSIYAMPELLECIRNGWQALIPVHTSQDDKFLYRARYGRESSSILYFGNPWEEELALTFRVDNSGLGKGSNLFVPKMRDQAALLNHIEGEETVFADSLPSRKPRLFEAVLNLSSLPAGQSLQAEVSSKKDLDRIVYEIQLRGNPVFKARLSPRFIHRYQAIIRLDGRVIEPNQEAEIAADARILVEYSSEFFKCNAEKILSFPFVDGARKPAFAILLPQEPSVAERKEAANLRDYFRFTGDRKITVPGEIEVRQQAPEKPGGALFSIAVGRGGQSGIFCQEDKLSLRAENARQAQAMMKELMYVMDRRFPYVFNFSPVDSYTPEMLQKFQMPENPLPWQPCFESLAKK